MNHSNTHKNNGAVIILVLLALCLLPVVQAIGTVPAVTSDMLLFMRLNDTGSTFIDYSNYQLNGTGTNTTYNATGGPLGSGSTMFDAKTSGIATVASPIYNVSTALTIEAWVYPNDTSGAPNRIVDKRSGNFGYILYVTGTGGAFFVGNGTASAIPSTGSGQMAVGNWYHLVGTYNGTHAKTYLNGVLKATSSLPGGISSSSQPLRLGRDSSTAFFNGSLAYITIRNSTLTDAQVFTQYQTYVGCINLTEDFSFSADTTLCGGTYSLNDNSGNGAAIVGASNIVIDGAGSTLVGNRTLISYGIYLNSKSNVTIKNFNIDNYQIGVRADATSNINNITLQNINYTGRFIYANNYLTLTSGIKFNNVFLLNNTYNTSTIMSVGGIRIFSFSGVDNITNLTIAGNMFVQYNGTRPSITLESYDNVSIYNNTFYGSNTAFSYGINTATPAGKNLDIYGNYFTRNQYPIYVQLQNGSIIIRQNTFASNDEDLLIIDSASAVNIYNNTFYNTTANLDGYDSSVKLFNATNVRIEYNNFTYYGSTAVQIQNSTSFTIIGNSFNGIPMSDRGSYLATDYRDPYGAIKIVQLYKSYLGLGRESQFPANIASLSKVGSSNGIIANNTFDANSGVMLWKQGSTNISDDLANYWYSSFQFPTYLTGLSEYYIPSSQNNLTRYASGISYVMSNGYNGVYVTNYTIDRTYQTYTNINTTGDMTLVVNNLTKPLVYFDNRSTPCTDVNACTSISVTLPPKNITYILDNYSINQSAASRLYDPFSISTSSSNVRTITSTLTSTITNVSVILNISGIVPSSPRITYPNGSSEYPSYLYDSAAGTMTFNGSIPPGVSTVTLDTIIAENGCSSSHSPIIDCDEFDGLSDVGGEIGSFMVNILPGLFKLIVFLSLAVGLVLLFGVAVDAVKKGGFGGF